jgi:exopolyphosphatase/pppGpp-phosphohydrolase
VSEHVALLEMGTHSLKFHRFCEETHAGPRLRTTKYAWDIGRPAFRLGRLGPDQIDEVVRCIRVVRHEHDLFDLEKELVVATGVFRQIHEMRAAWRRIKNRVGLRPHLIDGEDEARLMVAAFRRLNLPRPALLCDVGGGCSQWVLLSADEPRFGSLPVGAIRNKVFFQHREPDPERYLLESRAHCEMVLSALPGLRLRSLAFSGGTARALFRLEKSRACAGAYSTHLLLASRVRARVHRIARDGPPRRERPDRRPVLLPGLLILESALARYGLEQAIYSGSSVRKGMVRLLLTLLDRYEGTVSHPSQLLQESTRSRPSEPRPVAPRSPPEVKA